MLYIGYPGTDLLLSGDWLDLRIQASFDGAGGAGGAGDAGFVWFVGIAGSALDGGGAVEPARGLEPGPGETR